MLFSVSPAIPFISFNWHWLDWCIVLSWWFVDIFFSLYLQVHLQDQSRQGLQSRASGKQEEQCSEPKSPDPYHPHFRVWVECLMCKTLMVTLYWSKLSHFVFQSRCFGDRTTYLLYRIFLVHVGLTANKLIKAAVERENRSWFLFLSSVLHSQLSLQYSKTS